MKVACHSILHDLLAKLDNMQDLDAAKQIAIEYIKEHSIKIVDSKRMLMTIQYQIFTIDKFYQYLYNSLLKFEGLGTVGHK